MAVDFDSPEFKSLSMKEKTNIAIEEFNKCQESYEYYFRNYAYTRHPNKGLIKMKPFDFQLDATVPISYVLQHGRTEKAKQKLKNYKFKFDYKNWWNKISEECIELAKTVPSELHNYYKITVQHEDYPLRIDTIILKSRQTGLSTSFRQLCIWYTNFLSYKRTLVLSKTDREAKKFLKDTIISWDHIPVYIKSRKISKNEHELWLSMTGEESYASAIQVIPPVTDAGRSFDPNLIILDEFSTYANSELWTAITMSVSAGGILVIISTPKGVKNLYHNIWVNTNRSFSVGISNEESSFRPVVIHWSQMPKEEFIRRGFDSPLAWYKHMSSKIAMKRGKKAVAQELDLSFEASGDTIDYEVIKSLKSNALETKTSPIILKTGVPNLIIYEKPKKDQIYMIGVDTAEGVHQDSDSLHVLKLTQHSWEVVAYFNANNISIKTYKDFVKEVGEFYNEAYLNIEKNNHGHVLLAYLVEDEEYNPNKILNTYSFANNKFSKDSKGWSSNKSTRNAMVRILLDHLIDNKDNLELPLPTIEQLQTFVLRNGKWEAEAGYHDDDIISLGLAHIGCLLLPKYKTQILAPAGEYDTTASSEIDYDNIIASSTFAKSEIQKLIDSFKKELTPNLYTNSELRKKSLSEIIKLHEEKVSKKEKFDKDKNIYKYRGIASTEVMEIDEDDYVF